MSNLYANKVFSEHPIGLWSFDEEAHYIDLLTDSDRQIETWILDNLNAQEYTGVDVDNTPFTDSHITQIIPSDLENLECSIESSSLYNISDLYPDVPVSASLFMYFPESIVDYVDFGTTNGTDVEFTRHVIPSGGNRFWIKLTHLDINKTHEQLYLKVVYQEFSTEENVTWLLNGLSLGQYSETLSSDSLGIHTTDFILTDDEIQQGIFSISDNIAYYETNSIGSKELNLKYIARDNRLLAFNSAMPMVYGSNYLTRLVPIDGLNEGSHPSLIFDGNGFLSESGRFDTFTLEFWMRINNSSVTPRKIFGTTSNHDDGLWITSSILTFVVGDKVKISYNVGSFSDPMLIHLIYTPTSISLMINGEIVASSLIDNINSLSFATASQKWLGFWSYSEFEMFEIDCMSLFGYAVPELIARRRFVWGQGVTDATIVANQYQGKSVVADFSASKSTSNIAYPLNNFWESGNSDNLKTVNNKLTVEQKPLPQVQLDSYSKTQWYSDMDTHLLEDGSDEVYLTFRPDVDRDWSSENCYAYFNRLGQYLQNSVGFFIEFSTYNEFYNCTLLKLTSNLYQNKEFKIELSTSGPTVFATYTENDISHIIHSSTYNDQNIQIIYINFSALLEESDSVISDGLRQMLSNSDDINIYVGGDGTTTFSGRIYRSGIVSNQNYLINIKENIPYQNRVINIMDKNIYNESFDVVSYTWLPKKTFGEFYEDVGLKGFWNDYISMSQLAGIVTDIDDEQGLSVDNIQFNIGHTRPKAVLGPTYEDLSFDYYGHTYDDLKLYAAQNILFYNDIAGGAVYSTRDVFIKSFLSFQKIAKPIKQRYDLVETYQPPVTDVIVVSDYANHFDSEFEILDGTSIIPPQSNYPSKIMVVLSLEFSVPGTQTFPVSVKSLELTSFALNKNTFTSLSTKSGKDIYPIINNGMYYDFLSYHPFRIDKRNYPYLYMGRESGFISNGQYQEDFIKGFQVTIPEGLDSNYAIDNIQFWMKRNKTFPMFPEKILTFNYVGNPFYLTVQSFQADQTRGIVKAFNADGTPYTDITFFQNGNLIAYPIVSTDQWAAINIAFPSDGLKLGGSIGRINLGQDIIFNNIAYYPVRQAFGSNVVEYNHWSNVLETTIDEELITLDWQYWKGTITDPVDWYDVLVKGKVSTKKKELSQIIYGTYIGTQFIRFGGEQSLKFQQGHISIYPDTIWSSNSIIPV